MVGRYGLKAFALKITQSFFRPYPGRKIYPQTFLACYQRVMPIWKPYRAGIDCLATIMRQDTGIPGGNKTSIDEPCGLSVEKVCSEVMLCSGAMFFHRHDCQGRRYGSCPRAIGLQKADTFVLELLVFFFIEDIVECPLA